MVDWIGVLLGLILLLWEDRKDWARVGGCVGGGEGEGLGGGLTKLGGVAGLRGVYWVGGVLMG